MISPDSVEKVRDLADIVDVIDSWHLETNKENAEWLEKRLKNRSKLICCLIGDIS